MTYDEAVTSRIAIVIAHMHSTRRASSSTCENNKFYCLLLQSVWQAVGMREVVGGCKVQYINAHSNAMRIQKYKQTYRIQATDTVGKACKIKQQNQQ